MDYSEQIKRFAFDLMVIHKYSCQKCKNTFIQAISTSDTDIVPIFFSSVYAPKSETLIIMELTIDECRFGWNESMPKRAGKIFNNDTFFYLHNDKICPACDGKLKHEQAFKLGEYIKENPNVCVAYFVKDNEEVVEHLWPND